MDSKPDSTPENNNERQPEPVATTPVAPVPPTPPASPVTPPPKKGLSTGALVAIIVGSIVGLLFIVGTIVAIMLFARALDGVDLTTDDTNTSQRSDRNASPDFSDLTKYDSPDFTFSYPSAWQQKDTSNQTNIIGGETPDAYVVILSEQEDSPVIVNYTYTKGSAEPVEKERARSAMKTALQTQINASESQLLSMRESSGHGCAANISYTDQPVYMEEGDLIGYAYGYTCDSYYGPVQGVYGVWYDEFGAQHRLLVSSLQQYWDDNQSGLEAILKSAKAL